MAYASAERGDGIEGMCGPREIAAEIAARRSARAKILARRGGARGGPSLGGEVDYVAASDVLSAHNDALSRLPGSRSSAAEETVAAPRRAPT